MQLSNSKNMTKEKSKAFEITIQKFKPILAK